MDCRSSFASANCLITGGLGFIGSSLALRLVELGAHVTLVDAMIPEYGGNLFNIEAISVSFVQPEAKLLKMAKT